MNKPSSHMAPLLAVVILLAMCSSLPAERHWQSCDVGKTGLEGRHRWNEDRIRTILQRDLEACRGCRVHISLKDIETVQGDVGRLSRFTEIARETADSVAVA